MTVAGSSRTTRSSRWLNSRTLPGQGYASSQAYYKSEAPTIAHFYEKLLKLKGLMNTPSGKEMAEERHGYMEGFLQQFYREWDPS